MGLAERRTPLVIVYAISCVGSVAGGWISSALLNSGKSLNTSRKVALLDLRIVRCARAVRALYEEYLDCVVNSRRPRRRGAPGLVR